MWKRLYLLQKCFNRKFCLMTTPSHSKYVPATSSEEAERKYNHYKTKDPLPEVDPALLNSSDVYAYICLTGIVFPFTNDETLKKKLKPASYNIDLLGTISYIDDTGERINKE